MTAIVIDDLVRDITMRFELEDDIKNVVLMEWQSEDKLLHDLQNVELFKDRWRWCDLDPLHIRVMLVNNLNMMDNDPSDRVLRSLKFLLCVLMHCVEDRTGMSVNLMVLSRHSDSKVSYEVAARYGTELEFPSRKPFRLQVVVDNTN